MKRILLLSDTHNYIDTNIKNYITEVDEVWHAGDIGNSMVTDTIKSLKPLKAVYGNIDDKTIRAEFPLDQIFNIEGVKIWMTHIGGHPNHYRERVRNKLDTIKPDIFICGHSHILKVKYDHQFKLLHMNPGAAGKYGFHKVRTMLRFTIDKSDIKDLEVVELNPR